MKKVPAVLAVMALIALPILAAPKPTPTPAAGRIKLNGSGGMQREIKGRDQGIAAHKEGAPITPTPTARPVGIVEYKDGEDGVNRKTTPKASGPRDVPSGQASGRIKQGGQTVSNKEGVPTPTPTPAASGSKVVMQDFHFTGSAGHKEGAPGTPTPTPAASRLHSDGAGTDARTGRIGGGVNMRKEGAPVTPTPTAGPVKGWSNHDNMSKREAAPGTPTPTAGPVK